MAMGSLLRTTLANIFMDSLENKCLKDFPRGLKPV